MFKRTKTNLIVHGIILLAVAVFCFATPRGTLLSMAWILGLLFIVGGLLTFIIGRNRNQGTIDTLHLVVALLMVAVGIFVIVRPESLAVLVGLVVLTEGIDFTIRSFQYRRAGIRHWVALLIIGLLGILLGAWSVLTPWVGATMLSIVVGAGCLSVSIECFMALVGISRVQALVNNVSKAIDQSTEFQEAEVVE